MIHEVYAYLPKLLLKSKIEEPELKEPTSWIEVDFNTTGHCAVVAHPKTGKVLKLGKSGLHIHRKYRDLRRRFQCQGKYRKLKQAKQREKNKIRDIIHKKRAQ